MLHAASNGFYCSRFGELVVRLTGWLCPFDCSQVSREDALAVGVRAFLHFSARLGLEYWAAVLVK